MTRRFELDHPLHPFRFQVDFYEHRIAGEPGSDVPLFGGAFSECTGLEATMEPKVIQEGGRNYGAAQRVGRVSFATVVLKRGLSAQQDAWRWFKIVGAGGSSHRLTARITVFDHAGVGKITWKLAHALPTKFKAAELNAAASEVGIEELHLAHEGLDQEERPAVASLYQTTGS